MDGTNIVFSSVKVCVGEEMDVDTTWLTEKLAPYLMATSS